MFLMGIERSAILRSGGVSVSGQLTHQRCEEPTPVAAARACQGGARTTRRRYARAGRGGQSRVIDQPRSRGIFRLSLTAAMMPIATPMRPPTGNFSTPSSVVMLFMLLMVVVSVCE